MEQTHESPLPPLNAASFRKKKETVYFIVIIIVSLAIWGGSAGVIVYGVLNPVEKNTVEDANLCYLKYEDSAYVIPQEEKEYYVDEGETCVDPSSLTEEERKAALDEYALYYQKKESEAGLIETGLGLLAILFGFLLFGFLVHLYALAFVRMSGIRVRQDQFTPLWESSMRLSARLGLKNVPDIFILNGEGMLNAFATKLIRRKIIVIFSDLAEVLSEPENQRQLEAVLAHEIAHHALGHTKLYHWLLFPGEFIPFITMAWSREREYSADRVMQALIEDQESYERGLIKLAAGKMFGRQANIDRYVEQINDERGFMVKWAEFFSSHPFLPKRIRELRRYREYLEIRKGLGGS